MATPTNRDMSGVTRQASSPYIDSAYLHSLRGGSGGPTFTIIESFDTSNIFTIGAQSGGAIVLSTDTTQTHNGSARALKMNYPIATGGVYCWATYSITAQNASDVLIDYYVRMPSTVKQGLKHLKIFGQSSGAGNYANVTLALDYAGADKGAIAYIAFGDGSTVGNDTANIINLDGTYPSWIGRSYGAASVSTPQNARWPSSNWGTAWHHIRFYCKFNSGTSAVTEVADGAFYLEIDGVVYCRATGLLNRHYSNLPIDRVELGGWAQSGTDPFEIWYDDFRLDIGATMP